MVAILSAGDGTRLADGDLRRPLRVPLRRTQTCRVRARDPQAYRDAALARVSRPANVLGRHGCLTFGGGAFQRALHRLRGLDCAHSPPGAPKEAAPAGPTVRRRAWAKCSSADGSAFNRLLQTTGATRLRSAEGTAGQAMAVGGL